MRWGAHWGPPSERSGLEAPARGRGRCLQTKREHSIKKGTWGRKAPGGALRRGAIGRSHPPAPTRYSQTNCGPRRVPVLCRAEQRGADEPVMRESAAATMAWRTVHMFDVPKSIGRSKRPKSEIRGFCTDFKLCRSAKSKGGGSPSKRQTHKAMPCLRPKRGGHVQLGPLRTHRALLLRSGASATFPAEPQRPQGPLCDRTLLTRSFVIAPARLLSRHERYGTCAPRALAVAMLGPHHGAPSPRARCQGGLPRNPQRRPSLTTDEGASYRPPDVDCARFADVQVAPVLGILTRSQAAAPSELDIPRTARMT